MKLTKLVMFTVALLLFDRLLIVVGVRYTVLHDELYC